MCLQKAILNFFLVIIQPWKLMIQVAISSSSWWQKIRRLRWHSSCVGTNKFWKQLGKKGNLPQVCHLLNRIWIKSGKLEECSQMSPSGTKLGWGRWITAIFLALMFMQVQFIGPPDFVFNFEPPTTICNRFSRRFNRKLNSWAPQPEKGVSWWILT